MDDPYRTPAPKEEASEEKSPRQATIDANLEQCKNTNYTTIALFFLGHAIKYMVYEHAEFMFELQKRRERFELERHEEKMRVLNKIQTELRMQR